MRTITDITEAISTIDGIDWVVRNATLYYEEDVLITRESDGSIMIIAPYADKEETAVGYSTYLNREAIAEGDYITEDAVELDQLEELVTEWANS